MSRHSGGLMPTDIQTIYYPLPITNYLQMNNHLLPFITSLSWEIRNVWFWLGVSQEDAVI